MSPNQKPHFCHRAQVYDIIKIDIIIKHEIHNNVTVAVPNLLTPYIHLLITNYFFIVIPLERKYNVVFIYCTFSTSVNF